MYQLSRAAMKSCRLVKTATQIERFPMSFPSVSKLFSTEAAQPSSASSGDSFLHTPSPGLIYGKILNITKHTSKADIINLLEDSNMKPGNLKVEYNKVYDPTSMMVEFSSRAAYDNALNRIIKKGRLFNLQRAEKAQWDTLAPYDGKAILLQGLPRPAVTEDVERFFSGCQYNPSFMMFNRQMPPNGSIVRMAVIHFPSQCAATHAYITKNGGFCQNNQITLQLLY